MLSCAGCATLRDGPTHVLVVLTDPPGATCALTRDGMSAGHLPATPGRIELPRGDSPVEYACTSGGHLEERDTIEIVRTGDLEDYAKALRVREAQQARADAWARTTDAEKVRHVAWGATKAFVLLGLLSVGATYGLSPGLMVLQVYQGAAGVAADAQGALDPATGAAVGYAVPAIRFVPASFPDAAARDAFFDERRQRVHEAARVAHDVLAETACKSPFRKDECERGRQRVDATRARRLDNLERQRNATCVSC